MRRSWYRTARLSNLSARAHRTSLARPVATSLLVIADGEHDARRRARRRDHMTVQGMGLLQGVYPGSSSSGLIRSLSAHGLPGPDHLQPKRPLIFAC